MHGRFGNRQWGLAALEPRTGRQAVADGPDDGAGEREVGAEQQVRRFGNEFVDTAVDCADAEQLTSVGDEANNLAVAALDTRLDAGVSPGQQAGERAERHEHRLDDPVDSGS